MQFDPHHLAALSAVLRLGSFESAAHTLNVTPSAISQRIRALEDRIGAALIHRGTPCTATATGQRLAKHAEDVGLLEAQVSRELALDPGEAPTRVRIAVNADSLATWFIDVMAQIPEMLFDLVIDDQDHSAEWLKRGEVSAAICASDRAITGCDMHDLGVLRYIATASPKFHQTWFPDGVTPGAVARAPMLTFNSKDMLQRRWIEENVGQKLSPPSHYLPSSTGFVDAARADIGWGMNPLTLVRGPLRNGRLVPVIPDRPLDVPLSWQISRVMSPALEPLTKSVKHVARKQLIQN
ncbi:MAG: LysR family transcriptional regulator ArgP [Paracoccaceae bacterium]|jgi:LysR family transcriptional regulator (chromosome initiation inhibitor)